MRPASLACRRLGLLRAVDAVEPNAFSLVVGSSPISDFQYQPDFDHLL
jgi:hypothetical protein